MFKTNLLATINWTYPSIIVLASLSIFICTYFLFGPYEALIAFFLYGFTAKSSLQLLYDGGYPNLIAAHIFLPLFILFYVKAFLSKNLKRQVLFSIISLLFATLVVLTHHISSFNLAGTICVSLPFLVGWKWATSKWTLPNGILVFAFMAGSFGLGAFVFFQTNLLLPIKNIYLYGSSNFDPSGLWPIRSYPISIGASITLLGITGAILLGLGLIVTFKKNATAKAIVILSWLLLLFVGSRLKMASPERMARDMVVPLTISAGFSAVYLAKTIQIKWAKALLFIIIIFLATFQLKNRALKATRYEPMIRHTSANEEVMHFLSEKPGAILTNQLDNYAPILYPNRMFGYNFTSTLDPSFARPYRYIIITTRQDSWLPGVFRRGTYENMSSLSYKKIAAFSSPINDLELYEQVLP